MTTSLLRRIWQQITTETPVAPTRQRLTGFEPLEPRMVLSGFIAYYTPDYSSPPPGDFSHIDRSGAEIARPMGGYGGNAGYNSFGPGMAEPVHEYRLMEAEPVFALFRQSDWLSSVRAYDDVHASDSPSDLSVIGGASSTPASSISYSISYQALNQLSVDRILTDLRPLTSSGSQFGALSSFSMMSVSVRSLTDRDYTPVNAGGAVERHSDIHDYAALTHGSGSDASLALVVARPMGTTERGATNSAFEAALASQAAGAVNLAGVHATDGSTTHGQTSADANSSSDHQQNGLLELTDAERLKLRRKLAEGTTENEEASNSEKGRSEQYDEGDIQVAYDPNRPFDVTAAPQGQLRLDAAANLADDGLIEVLAADVTSIVASSEVIGMASTNRQLVMEPAVATYQAFDIVADGDAQAADIAADAAHLAGAVAMNAQPVVQAE